MSSKAKKGVLIALSVLLVVLLAAKAVENLQHSSTKDSKFDLELARVIGHFNLRPLQTRHFEEDPKFGLGRALFFDPVLSGPRDVSCATCHLLKHGTSDALPRSIGVLGVGLGPNRRLTRGDIEHPRNALDLWNRDHNAVKSLFWDGRVEVLDPIKRSFRSPLGDALPPGLENALAIQALFPLVRSDEMLGRSGDRSSKNLPNAHADLPNDLVPSDDFGTGIERIQEAHRRIMNRLLGSHKQRAEDWQERYRSLFKAAYPDKVQGAFSVVELANALAHFQELAFATRGSAWDGYLAGHTKAITNEAKAGALLFFVKGRCVVCHEPPLFSDFAFHSIGVRVSSLTGAIPDYGRWHVTGRTADKYKFRTPPLRNVRKTSPYFHNGSEATLRGAIRKHLDPLDDADKYNRDGSFAMTVEQIDSVSTILLPRIDLTEEEIDQLIAFLATLDYEPSHVEAIVPKAVPSGLSVLYE